MNRRHAVKQLLYVSAGVALLPACMQDKSKASVILKNLSVNGSQEKMLAELAETIIPKTATPGAKDISAHFFVLKMMDDCSSKKDQQQFIKGMEAFTAECKKQYGSSFTDCAPEKRNAFLQQMETAKEKNSDPVYFYNAVKRLTIQAYTTSKFFLTTTISVYKLVPGRYYGCVPVKAAS